MADIFDYLLWRGDLTMARAPFNEVDNLILCTLSYVALDKLVAPTGGNKRMTVRTAADALFSEIGWPEQERRAGFWENVLRLFAQCAPTERFGEMELSLYVNHIDEDAEVQFSATTISLGDGTHFVAFRGTDNTIVGWKEDFNMSFMAPVPSQLEAVEYLEAVASACAGPLRVGGHSKGGNLAVYACTRCAPEVRARVVEIYNNDGPGFCSGALDGSAYEEILARVHTYVPQDSVVGMLLDHEENYTVVRSKGLGILQHDPHTWQVEGRGFICLDTVTGSSRFVDKTLKDWVAAMDQGQRVRFVDALFEILEATGAKTLDELEDTWLKSAIAIVRKLRDLDEETRKVLLQVLSLLMKSAQRSLSLPRLTGAAVRE